MVSASNEIKLEIPDIELEKKNNQVNIHRAHIPIHLKFDNLTVKTSEEKVILQNVSGEFCPGEMVAIMGPSGAGKTTLLNFLAGRTKGMELVNGNITINGKKSIKTIRRRIGYVLQEDVFFSHLTVDQTLRFVGDIRLSDSLNKEEKNKIVDEVIDELDLRKCANTIMGGGGGGGSGVFIKGCSGGEKKRCSIATELITNPSLLMMDEPTSGLDSSTAFNLVQTLKNLAHRENRTIVTTIHQPSSHVFHLFDKLILICQGKVAYFGKTSDMLSFFEHIGKPSYPNWNPADFIMEVLTTETKLSETIADKFIEYESTRRKEDAELIEIEYHVTVTSCNGIKNVAYSPDIQGNGSVNNGNTENDHANADVEQAKLSRWPTGFTTQFTALLKRSFIQSKQSVLDKLFLTQMFGITTIVCLLWFNTPFNEESIPDRQGTMFFVLTYLTWHSLFYSVFLFPGEREVIQKERASGMYRLSAYYFAKMLSELPSLLLQPVIMHILTYWITGLNRSPYFLLSFFAILTSVFLAQSIGLVIGGAIRHFKRAMTTVNIIAYGTMMAGGFFTKSVSSGMQWAKYLSNFTYAFNILLRVEFEHATETFTCATESAYKICKNNSTNVLTGADILPNAVTIDLGIGESFALLWFIILLLRILFYIVLRYLNKPT